MIRYESLKNSPLGLFNYKWYVEVSDISKMFSKIPDDTLLIFAGIQRSIMTLGTVASNTYDINKVTNIKSIKVKMLKELQK